MPPCRPSAFLESHRPALRDMVDALSRRFDYISILGTDDTGLAYRASPGETSAGEPMWVQRGFVARAQREGRIVEKAFNLTPGQAGQVFADSLASDLEALFEAAPGARAYPALPDEAAAASHLGSLAVDPFEADPEDILSRLSALRDGLLAAPQVASAWVRAEFVQVSRIFLSPHRDLSQAFPWAQAYLFGIARRGQVSKLGFRPVSGLLGLEILDDLEPLLPGLAAELADLLDAVKIEPREYEVILKPDMAGTLAHEAFGHGVELDMFVKERAKAADYMGRPVASPMVNMFDGAQGVEQTGSFLFDDEGSLGSTTQVIKDGILIAGFSDSLSALALGLSPTGNGRRQAYDHKAYARMTNTWFSPGSSTLDEMVAATQDGWLLEGLDSGMEDPRNWGIQLKALIGREIKGGRLTGRIASPVVCSGYVPDVLGAITMLSGDFELGGSGSCGKGYKEYVKVSCGGPCVKTRMRLG